MANRGCVVGCRGHVGDMANVAVRAVVDRGDDGHVDSVGKMKELFGSP